VTRRVVLLGASNMTRGLAGVLGALLRLWPDDRLDAFAAVGHGRSYGAQSWVAGRSLPGILQSNLWESLSQSPAAQLQADATHALIEQGRRADRAKQAQRHGQERVEHGQAE